MDKDYMLGAVNERIGVLEARYREYFDTDTGPSRTYMGAACSRSRVRKDLGTLRLIGYLLAYCPDSMEVDSEDIIRAFDRLTDTRGRR